MNLFIIRIFIFLSIFFVGTNLFAQTDSVTSKKILYTHDYKFNDGVFINIEQLRNNSPILKERLLNNADFKSFDFFEILLEGKTFYFFDDAGIQAEYEVEKIWGYSDKGILYINFNNRFNRIAITGNLCYFVSYKDVVNTQAYNPYNTMYYNRNTPTSTSKTKEMEQYIFSFKTGEIAKFNYKTIKAFIMEDLTLYDEYNELNRRKKKKYVFLFLRKFNKSNPLYIK